MSITRIADDGIVGWIKHSVRRKLMLLVSATTLVALAVTGAAMMIYDLRTYHQAWVDDLMAQADLLGRASAPALIFDDPKVAQENLALLKVRPKVSAAAIYTAKGALFAFYMRDDTREPQFPQAPQAQGYRVDGNQLSIFKKIENDGEVLGTVYLRTQYELVERLGSYLVILGTVMGLSLIIAILMTSWMQNALTKPILEITEVARHVMVERDFSLRVRKSTQDEIGYLVDTFNAMLVEVGRRAEALEETNRTLEHEMTERRGAEQALLIADRRKDEFLATLAHELRNPLAPMRNALEILRGDASVDAAQRARDMMERQLRQLVHLVNDLLDVSRITTGKMMLKKEPTELQNIVRSAVEAVQPFIEARGLKLTLTLPDEPVFLFADATRLAQVFLNLLNNAAKFTDAGGQIGFAAELKGGELIVTVSDTGIGIPPDMLPVIFDMFTQVDRSLERPQAGLGVGLSLARHLIELHDGTISAYSDGLGHGSKFIVRLPVVEVAVPNPVAADVPAAASAATPQYRVLLADDNTDFAASLALLLQTLGHEVRIANDGMEALAAAAEFKPHVAFLDIGLPKLNGYDLARRLRAAPETQHSMLVAVTGWGQEDDKRRAREAGFDHHLVKPVEFEHIQDILKKLAPGT